MPCKVLLNEIKFAHKAKEVESLMAGSVEMVKAAVENYFKTDNLTYEPFDENNVARTGFGVKAKLGRVDVLFIAYDNNLIIHTFIPFKVEEEERAKVGEFLLRANDGLKTGCFDFNFANSRISYRVSIFCGNKDFSPPTYEQIDYAVIASITTVQRYGNALMKVVFGFAEPQEAIDEIE